MKRTAGKRIFPTEDKELINFAAGSFSNVNSLTKRSSLNVLTALKYLSGY